MCNPFLILAIFNPFLTMTMQWLEVWQRAARSSADAEQFALVWNPWQFRSSWFEGLSEVTDSYMRSPLFLQWMQSYLKATTRPLLFVPLLPFSENPRGGAPWRSRTRFLLMP